MNIEHIIEQSYKSKPDVNNNHLAFILLKLSEEKGEATSAFLSPHKNPEPMENELVDCLIVIVDAIVSAIRIKFPGWSREQQINHANKLVSEKLMKWIYK